MTTLRRSPASIIGAALLALSFVSDAAAQQPWTPQGQGTGMLNRPSDATNVQPISRGALEAMASLIAKHDPEAADEILEADANGSVSFVWYETVPGGKSNRGMTAPGQNTSGVRRKPGTKTQKASTLYHEWLHMRNVKGRDGDPTTTEEEAEPCAHAEVFEEQLMMLCALAACDASGQNTNTHLNWTEADCLDFREVCASWLICAVRCELAPYQIPETPTAIPPGWSVPEKPCTPEGC